MHMRTMHDEFNILKDAAVYVISVFIELGGPTLRRAKPLEFAAPSWWISEADTMKTEPPIVPPSCGS